MPFLVPIHAMETILLYDVENYLCWDKATLFNMLFFILKLFEASLGLNLERWRSLFTLLLFEEYALQPLA